MLIRSSVSRSVHAAAVDGIKEVESGCDKEIIAGRGQQRSVDMKQVCPGSCSNWQQRSDIRL